MTSVPKELGHCYTKLMHIFFSGIGGTGIGPLALIAKQAGYEVSGSDKQDSAYIHYLREHGINSIYIGQTSEQIAANHSKKPIDWYVYSSAVAIEQPNAPEIVFARNHNIKSSKRDELLNHILIDKQLKLIAIAGTHGKTTTTAMMIWAFKQLSLPVSYSIGAKLSYGDMGEYDPKSEYFVYECDEFDRNFLAFQPHMSLVTGIDWDHPDIYPTREEYNDAFREFLSQSGQTVLWQSDIERLAIHPRPTTVLIHENDPTITSTLRLSGAVNRQNAWQVAQGLHRLTGRPLSEIITILNEFPGVARRFERITSNLYSDYAHTPPKVRGALQIAEETGGQSVVVIYEGLHNTRQHFILAELRSLFDDVKQLYIVPSYL
ncbi:MAG: Mur ligase domain-containing protein, partial [Microcoleus sp.]